MCCRLSPKKHSLYQRDGIWGARGKRERKWETAKGDGCRQFEWISPCHFSSLSHSSRFTYLLTSSAFILHQNKQKDKQCAYAVSPPWPAVTLPEMVDLKRFQPLPWWNWFRQGRLSTTNLLHHQNEYKCGCFPCLKRANLQRKPEIKEM